MNSNILKAMNNIATYASNDLIKFYVSNNRANNMGDALEVFVRDMFCNTFNFTEKDAIKRYSEVFSYLGNASNPPDIIIKGGDAIEVKKLEGFGNVSLNSSYPEQKISNNSTMITNACKHCEDGIGGWQEKDLIYFIGNVSDKSINDLFIIYGNCYAASVDIYENVRDNIKNNLNGMDFVNTNEIGKIKKVDPLGITDLRIRGMWNIENPRKVFGYILNEEYNNSNEMNVFLILTNEKYNSFSLEDRRLVEDNMFLQIKDVKIKSPDNPANLIDAKLISYHLVKKEDING